MSSEIDIPSIFNSGLAICNTSKTIAKKLNKQPNRILIFGFSIATPF
jgi:hypothetical protein